MIIVGDCNFACECPIVKTVATFSTYSRAGNRALKDTVILQTVSHPYQRKISKY